MPSIRPSGDSVSSYRAANYGMCSLAAIIQVKRSCCQLGLSPDVSRPCHSVLGLPQDSCCCCVSRLAARIAGVGRSSRRPFCTPEPLHDVIPGPRHHSRTFIQFTCCQRTRGAPAIGSGWAVKPIAGKFATCYAMERQRSFYSYA